MTDSVNHQQDYFWARYFSWAQGRFTSPDEPGADWSLDDPQSWSLYNYVRNNPLKAMDPTGKKCVSLDGGGTGDDGQGKPCKDKSFKTTHGATVNGDTDEIGFYVFANAVAMGDVDPSGRRDFVRAYEPEDMMALRSTVQGLIQNPLRAGSSVVLDVAKRQRMNVRKPPAGHPSQSRPKERSAECTKNASTG